MSNDFTRARAVETPPPLIGALLRMPHDAVMEGMLAGVRAAGFTDVNASHLALARYPGPEGRRPSDLARDARMTRQAVNYLLGELERLGYLTRRDDPSDRRAKRIHLTGRGRALARTIRETVGRIEAEWERELGPERFAALRGLLTDLNATGRVRALGAPAGAGPRVADGATISSATRRGA